MEARGKKYSGTLTWHFETGCEGVKWVLEVDPDQQGSSGLAYGTLAFLEPGDHLRIIAPYGVAIFRDTIKPDMYKGFAPYPIQWHWIGRLLVRVWHYVPAFLWHPLNRRGYFVGQPAALGYWIHWTQRGWEPDAWARLFMPKAGKEPYRAELTKKAAA